MVTVERTAWRRRRWPCSDIIQCDANLENSLFSLCILTTPKSTENLSKKMLKTALIVIT